MNKKKTSAGSYIKGIKRKTRRKYSVEEKEFHSLINSFKSFRKRILGSYVDALTESQRVLQLIKEELGETE